MFKLYYLMNLYKSSYNMSYCIYHTFAELCKPDHID